jgi:RNA polymerase sigma-70 factor (ECF subfamily)
LSISPDEDQRVAQFVRLLGQHDRGLQTLILSLVPNWADAEDIAQEVRVRLWEQFDAYDPTKDFGAWSRAIAKYQVLTYRKRQSRHAKFLSGELLNTIALKIESLSDKLLGEDEALRACFKKLSPTKQALLTSHYSDGQTTHELAAKSGQSYEALRKAILRARMALSDCVEDTLKRGGRQ